MAIDLHSSEMNTIELANVLTNILLTNNNNQRGLIIPDMDASDCVFIISHNKLTQYKIDHTTLKAVNEAIGRSINEKVVTLFENTQGSNIVLTKRQLEILNLISKGFNANELATCLGISYFTVTTHIKNIYANLKVNNRTEAIYEARQRGLLLD